jgi:hypothetical protein
MRWVVMLVMLSLIVPPVSYALEGPQEVEFPSRWGIVTFKHHRHQQLVSNCIVCHHQGVEMGACGACHGVLPMTPLNRDVLHKQCKDCHRDKRGPTDCAGCHNPEFVDESVFED